MWQALTSCSLSAPAPECPFSNTGSGIVIFSSPLYKSSLTEFTRDQWLNSHGITLPMGYGTWRQQSAREAWHEAALGRSRGPCSLFKLVVRANPAEKEPLPRRKTVLQQSLNFDNYRFVNPSSQILSLVLFKIPMPWGLNQLSPGKEACYLN